MSIFDNYVKDDYDTETLYQEWIERCTTSSGDKYTGEFYREMLTRQPENSDKRYDCIMTIKAG